MNGAPRLLKRMRAQRGAATLAVVMVLFFVVALTAAYLGRTLIFEQRTSANYFRSAQAFEAAEAGLEWATALLNSGRIDNACLPSTNLANTSFRQRYLSIDADTGNIDVQRWNDAGALRELEPQCVRSLAGWTCSCPSGGLAASAVPTDPGTYPAFRVRFEAMGQPGVVRVLVVACTSLNEDCLRDGIGSQGDAAARASVVLALAPALSTLPNAALTARGLVNSSGAAIGIHNTDTLGDGLTVNAGGAINVTGASLLSLPGSDASQSLAENDATLAALDTERMFAAFLGSSRSAYRLQAGAVRLSCGGGCGTLLQTTANENPGRIIWVEDDLVIDSPVTLGSVAEPVMIVSAGNVRLSSAGTRITGAIYSASPTLNNDGGAALLQGALIAEGSFIGAGTPVLHYDSAVLKALRRSTGSFVRVPGSWRDF